MTRRNQRLVCDHNKFEKLSRKKYRDAYLQAQVRTGVAYQIHALRKKFGLSQTDMALRTGKPQSTISRLENEEYGRVTLQTLLDIACAMDVALLVQFTSYPEFLERMSDKSETGMQPDTFDESKKKYETERAAQRLNTYGSFNQSTRKSVLGDRKKLLTTPHESFAQEVSPKPSGIMRPKIQNDASQFEGFIQ